jgi:hypothetical protein
MTEGWEGLPEPSEDWALVPREPTEEMTKAAVWALDRAKAKIGAHQDDRAFTPMEKHAVRYRAMIAAAPKKPTP